MSRSLESQSPGHQPASNPNHRFGIVRRFHVLGRRAFILAALALTLVLGAAEVASALDEVDAVIEQPDGVAWSAMAGGDFDGDGFDDVALSARDFDGGRVYIFYSPGGTLQATPGTVLTAPSTSRLGAQITAIGDVNDDGFGDLVATDSRTGSAYVFHGDPAGIASGVAADEADATLRNSPRRAFAIGDVNGDQIDDVAMSETFDSTCGCQRVSVGRVRIYYGSSTGLDTADNTLHAYPDFDSRCNCRKIGGFACSTRVCAYGFQIQGGDFDNDGINDVVMNANGYNRDGKFYLYQGVIGDLAANPDVEYFALDNEQPTIGGGDMNSDGFDDLLLTSTTLGTLRIFEGSSGGIDATVDATLATPVDDTGDGQPGNSVVGDFDGDGFLDVLTAQRFFDLPGLTNAGAAFVYRGSATGLEPIPIEVASGEAPNQQLGRLAVALGDVDGDLADDFALVGFAVSGGAATATGEAQIFLGEPAGDPSLVLEGGLDEGSGTTTTAGGVTGNLVGGATWGVGQQGAAIELDGTGYVLFEDDGAGTFFDLETAGTWAIWVRPDTLGGNRTLLSKDEAYELEIGKLGDAVWNIRLNNEVQGMASTPIQEGVWQHLAVTYDGTTVRYYTNGVPDGSDPFAGPITTNDTDVGLGARPGSVVVGGPTFFTEGALDGVLIYDRALSDAEIADLFSSTVTDVEPPVRSNGSPDGVVATAPVALGLDTDEDATCRRDVAAGVRWAEMADDFATTGGTAHSDSLTPATDVTLIRVRCRDGLGNTNTTDFSIGVGIGGSDISSDVAGEWLFEEGAGCTTADASAHGQTGDLSNSLGTCDASDDSPQWQANEADATPGPCFSGQCLAFDGNDKVSVTVGDALRVLPQELTVSAWVRHDPILTSTFSMIADLRGTDVDSGLQALGFALALDPTGKGYFRVRGTTVVGALDLDDGEWHHLVGVWRFGSVGVGSMQLYVDGALDGSQNEGSASYNLAASTQLQIGHRFNADETMHNFEGELDTISAYDRALDDLEVFDLYLATRP